MDKLFVYGIFLDEYQRAVYGMGQPRYAVVEGYKTRLIVRNIVEAVPDKSGALTGLIVELPASNFETLDSLERGYDRIKVKTTSGTEAFMYVAR